MNKLIYKKSTRTQDRFHLISSAIVSSVAVSSSWIINIITLTVPCSGR